MKYEEINGCIRSLTGLYNDQRLKPALKLAVYQFVRELTKQMQDIAIVVNDIYLKEALKDEGGNIITHKFDIKYAQSQHFKDKTRTIIFIPITNAKEQYTIEMPFGKYQEAHAEACKFMENEYQPKTMLKISLDEACQYNLSGSEIETLENLGIVSVNSNEKRIIVPNINIKMN